MVETHTNFDNRLRLLGQKHKKMRGGYMAQVRGDGLIIVKPKRQGSWVWLRTLMLTTTAFVVMKAFMLSNLGQVGYNERVAALSEGTAVERVGAIIMQIDPASTYISTQIRPYLR